MKGLAGLLVIVAMFGGIFLKYYNQVPTLDETTKEKWSQVQNQYKRRADLIPNLVNTVQGYAAHEKGVFTEVTEARSKVSQMKIDASTIEDPKKLKEFEEAQKTLGGALGRLMAISENYPQLKADKNFLALQSQLEGTENRIAVARKDYIASVKEYNLALRTFPGKFVAQIFHPEAKVKDTFEAAESEQKTPEVSFK
ncbi:LemA family protein [Campylobacter sp. RM16192]|uniref:LemA family protein n=1 Tax=Campylobacter sp. RM16192 TaxID=1660080 RepID=UPI0014510BE9|nr:LemA family protein [Campylobacter sp. RM16192]QCD52535.1 LemA protein [Campylobacter sp. RM16192]